MSSIETLTHRLARTRHAGDCYWFGFLSCLALSKAHETNFRLAGRHRTLVSHPAHPSSGRSRVIRLCIRNCVDVDPIMHTAIGFARTGARASCEPWTSSFQAGAVSLATQMFRTHCGSETTISMTYSSELCCFYTIQLTANAVV